MSNNRPDGSKGTQRPGNGGTQGHRDGMKNPANVDAQRGSIGKTAIDQASGSGNDKGFTTTKEQDKSGPARRK